MKVCIIPARGGSKRILRKNIREFCGLPMIAWPIQIARESGLFNHIVVSTEDEEIAGIAKAYGAEVPFSRPMDLANDYTATRPVIINAIEELGKINVAPDYVCVIYPTAPFLQVDDLKHGFEQLILKNATFAFSVTNFSYPIQRALKINPTGSISMYQPEYRMARSQDLDAAYHDAGQFYWGQTEAFLVGDEVFSSLSVPIILPNWRVHDIDTEEDFVRAELIFEALKMRNKKLELTNPYIPRNTNT